MKQFWCFRGMRNVIVNEFNDCGCEFIVYRLFAKFKGYWVHEVVIKSVITRGMGKYYFKSKYLYHKHQLK